MICSKHRVEMPVVCEAPKSFVTAPLHRCPKCTEEFRVAFAKATRGPRQFTGQIIKQRVLPPVIMSERWP